MSLFFCRDTFSLVAILLVSLHHRVQTDSFFLHWILLMFFFPTSPYSMHNRHFFLFQFFSHFLQLHPIPRHLKFSFCLFLPISLHQFLHSFFLTFYTLFSNLSIFHLYPNSFFFLLISILLKFFPFFSIHPPFTQSLYTTTSNFHSHDFTTSTSLFSITFSYSIALIPPPIHQPPFSTHYHPIHLTLYNHFHHTKLLLHP